MVFIYLLLVLPYALLALAGVMLWRRRGTVATLLIALGFTAALLGELASIIIGFEVRAAMSAHRDTSLAPSFYDHLLFLLSDYGMRPGLCAAGVGLLWHVGAGRDARVS